MNVKLKTKFHLKYFLGKLIRLMAYLIYPLLFFCFVYFLFIYKTDGGLSLYFRFGEWNEGIMHSLSEPLKTLTGYRHVLQSILVFAYALFSTILSVVILFIITFYIARFIKDRIYASSFDVDASAQYDYELYHGFEHIHVISGKEWLKANKEERKLKKKKDREKEMYGYTSDAFENVRRNEEYFRQKEEEKNRAASQIKTEEEKLKEALILYMFDDLNFTQEDLTKRRRKLSKSFHSDESIETEEQQKRINDAYDILKANIKN